MEKFIDYMNKQKRRLVCPIGMGKSDFDFSCMSRSDFAQALGFEVDTQIRGSENKILSIEDVERIKQMRYVDYQYFEIELNNLEKSKQNSNTIFGGGCFGPLTMAADIIGIKESTKMVIKQPEVLKEFTSYINQFIVEFAKESQNKGADFFWIAEPVASMYSPKLFDEFSGKFLKEIYESIDIPGFLHVCGKTLKHTDGMLKTGAQVFSIDYVTDIVENIKMIPQDVVIMGNINPMLLYKGSKEEIIEEINSLNYKLKNYNNFIMSTGCLIPSKTPRENADLLMELTEKFYQDI